MKDGIVTKINLHPALVNFDIRSVFGCFADFLMGQPQHPLQMYLFAQNSAEGVFAINDTRYIV